MKKPDPSAVAECSADTYVTVSPRSAKGADSVIAQTQQDSRMAASRRPVDISGLNPQQREGVLATEGPVLLLAGAGTGKTRVVTHRIAHLIAQGVEPQHILAVTFTNKAAREMRERVGALLGGKDAEAITIGTFHSFCLKILRRQIHLLGYSHHFSICGEGYQKGLIRTVMSELGLVGQGRDPGMWLGLISKAKSAMHGPEDVREYPWSFAGELAEVYEVYQRRLQQMDQVDFDDLLVLVHRLWAQYPDVLAKHQDLYRYVMVDEYQDTNSVQFQLVGTLAGKRANLCVVGDDDQSIYGWRGADVGNILEFDQQFPGAKVIRLEQNYRSTSTILDAANAVIANNSARHAKKLWSERDRGEEILCVRCDDEEDEAKFVAEYLGERSLNNRYRYGEMAVLFRSNHQSRALENALRQAKIPYTLVGSNSFYQRKEILDAVSLLQTVVNPRDDQSLLRVLNVPPRGIGDVSIQHLRDIGKMLGRPLQSLLNHEEFLARLSGPAEPASREFHRQLMQARQLFAEPGRLAKNVESFFELIGYMEGLGRMYKPREDALKRRDNVLEFINAVAEYERRNGPRSTLQDFLEAFALLDAQDKEDKDGKAEESVTLMTVHASKGLEFPLVMVVGLERGLFPHRMALEEGGIEEERRLFYVAVTRAQRELVLAHAEKRRTRGQVIRQRPSPFLDEVPDELMRLCTPRNALAPVSKDAGSKFLAEMMSMFDDDEAESES
jgi:superfamily I DNA/RNA helicase